MTPQDLHAEIEELFSELWHVPRFAGMRRGFRPMVDSYRTDDPAELTVIVEVPGIDPKSLAIVVSERTLAVSGERLRRDRERDREDPVLVLRARAVWIDVFGEPDLAGERPVLDLHLLVDAPVGAVAKPLSGDGERALADDDREALRVDAGNLDHDGQLGRVVGAVAVDHRPEPAPQPREARHVPEVGEELLDLGLKVLRRHPLTPGHRP